MVLGWEYVDLGFFGEDWASVGVGVGSMSGESWTWRVDSVVSDPSGEIHATGL